MFARNSSSESRDASESFGSKSPNTLSWVSSVWAVFRSHSYFPLQKKVLPPSTCSMSSVTTPWRWSTAYSSGPKSSPTGPTGRTSVKKLAASEKCTAEPPSMRSRSPKGVLIASNAIEPTTVTSCGAEASGDHRLAPHERGADRGVRRARGAAGRRRAEARARRRRGADRGVARGHELRRHPPARELLPRGSSCRWCSAARWPARRPTAGAWWRCCAQGGYAEYAVAHESAVFEIPDGVDDGAALALLIQGLTAWHLFRTSSKLARGRVRGRGLRRRRRGKPRGAARQALRRRASDRHGEHRGEARA